MRWTSKDDCEWHSWFAWYPIKLTNTETWVWLERVDRRAIYNWGERVWRYRSAAT